MLPGLLSFPHWLVSSPRCGSQTSQQSCWSPYWKWRRQHCWSFPINHMRYHCAHLEKIRQAHMQIPRLYLVDGIYSCQSEASPPFLCDTVTLMAIFLCCTPRRDSYRIQHSDNWCLVRIRSNPSLLLGMTESGHRQWSEIPEPLMSGVVARKFFRFHLQMRWWIPAGYSWP